MAKEVAVTPAALRKVAQELSDRSDDANEVKNLALHNADSNGTPWGTDKMGRQFAEVSGGYKDQVKYTMDILQNLTDVLDFYSDALNTSADTMEKLS
jgi:uncharacterized protein YukE